MASFVTCDLCDENPELVSVVSPGFKNYGGNTEFHGEVVTVKCFEDNSPVKQTLATPGGGRVLVVDGGGSMRCALLGDMIAENAVENGWAGVIVYGCIRDVDAIAGLSIGVQALASIPIKSNRRGEGQKDLAVTFLGVTFNTGDFVYADNNGIIQASTALALP